LPKFIAAKVRSQQIQGRSGKETEAPTSRPGGGTTIVRTKWGENTHGGAGKYSSQEDSATPEREQRKRKTVKRGGKNRTKGPSTKYRLRTGKAEGHALRQKGESK